jgi:hypothetical protein
LEQAERVPVWKKMVEEFEQDGTKKNPYEMKITGMDAHIRFEREIN